MAHEVRPSVGDLTTFEGYFTLDVTLNIEGFIAGIDLSQTQNTNEAPQGERYDTLRALEPGLLESRFRAFWPEMARGISILADQVLLVPTLSDVEIAEVGDTAIPRNSIIRIRAPLPMGARHLQVGWAAEFGALILRQMGVQEPYDGYLASGRLSEPIPLAGGGRSGAWTTFLRYVTVGFDHIVPKGLDHILFVLGLFFLAARIRPLLWQVTAFTLAHTITLAAGVLGIISIPASIVEPIIAASIVYVAVENIISDQLTPWRPAIVFVFGLLHGLGFAGVLEEFGLPEGAFIPALLGFNVGVELGQIAVIATAFAVVGFWFRNKDWYRTRIAIPCSVVIGLVGAYLFLDRIFA